MGFFSVRFSGPLGKRHIDSLAENGYDVEIGSSMHWGKNRGISG